VEAVFILWEGDNVLQVPTSALFRHEEGWATFVLQDGKAQLRPVEIGHRSGLTAEILSGLEEGEAVIPHPDDSIGDGTLVERRAS
jgi:HlyD family secretion protein